MFNNLSVDDIVMISYSFLALLLSFAAFLLVRKRIKSKKDENNDGQLSRASTRSIRSSDSDNYEEEVDDEDENDDDDDDYDYIATCITVYADNGEIIQQFKGNLKVIEESSGYVFFYDGTMQHTIHSHGVIIIDS